MDEGRAKKIQPGFEKVRDVKSSCKRVGTKREKGDALVIKIEQPKYSGVLKAMRSDARLVDLGADVRSIRQGIRRTRTGGMILELKCDKERKGAAYKSLAEVVLGERAEVRALT